MKKIAFLLVVLGIITMSCQKDEVKPDYQPHKTYINGVAVANHSATKSQVLRDLKYIVKNANVILSYNDSINPNNQIIGFLFDNNRDTVNLRFVYDEFAILQSDGKINNALLANRDMVYVVRTYRGEFELPGIDTIAYTPNRILRRAETLVRAAVKANDWATCYAVMDTTFKFYPITGEQWRELKRKGIE
jgi:hypothetical protein